MNLKTRQRNLDFLQELKDYGFHIENPRPIACHKVGDLTTYDDEPCELLELIEITDYRELWLVKFFGEPEPTFILL